MRIGSKQRFGDKELDPVFRSRSATAVAFVSAYEIPAVLGLLAATLKLPAEGPYREQIWTDVRGLPVGRQRRRWRVPGRSLTWWRGVRVTGNWVKQPGSG
jgi:hypothetical protein